MRPSPRLEVRHRLWADGIDGRGVTHLLEAGYVPWCETEPKTRLTWLETPTLPTCLWCFVGIKR